MAGRRRGEAVERGFGGGLRDGEARAGEWSPGPPVYTARPQLAHHSLSWWSPQKMMEKLHHASSAEQQGQSRRGKRVSGVRSKSGERVSWRLRAVAIHLPATSSCRAAATLRNRCSALVARTLQSNCGESAGSRRDELVQQRSENLR